MRLYKLRLITLLLLLIFSVLLIVSPFFFEKTGVIVNFVEGECSFEEGSIITEIKGFNIKHLNDFEEIEKTIKKNEYVSVVVNGGPGGCIALEDGNLGIKVSDIPSKKLKFGSEIQGSKIISFSISNGNPNEVKNIIEKRIKLLGIPETEVFVEDNLINIKTIFTEKVLFLIEEGKLEARIKQELNLENGVAEVVLGDNSYKLIVNNKSEIKINNLTYKINQSFFIGNVEFVVRNITNVIEIEAVLFKSNEVELIGDGLISYQPSIKMYRIEIPIRISKTVSKKFVSLTKNIPIVPGQTPVLKAMLIYYLNEKKLSELSIPYDMKGKEIESISIIFFTKTKEEGIKLKTKVEVGSIGNVPKLEFVKEFYYPGKYYKTILYSAVLFTILITSVVLVISKKVNSITVGFKILGLVGVNIIILFGIAAFSQNIFNYGWIIDLASVIGIFTIILITTGKLLVIGAKNIELRKNIKRFEFLLIPFSFIMLFVLKGFGIALFFGIVIKLLFTDPLFEDFIYKRI